MASIGNLIGSILYPDNAVCLGCGTLHVDVPEYGLCSRCAEKLTLLEPPFCPRCGKPGWMMECGDCALLPPDALDGRGSAYAYEPPVSKLVQALKYSGVYPAARALAAGMDAVMGPEAYDALVPVPLYKGRMRRRGFNQAATLAEALASMRGIPAIDALVRVRNTQTQTRLTADGRKENMRGAFSACGDIRGMSILLIDDVLTTGATAAACAVVLKDAGAAKVVLLTAARADKASAP